MKIKTFVYSRSTNDYQFKMFDIFHDEYFTRKRIYFIVFRILSCEWTTSNTYSPNKLQLKHIIEPTRFIYLFDYVFKKNTSIPQNKIAVSWATEQKSLIVHMQKEYMFPFKCQPLWIEAFENVFTIYFKQFNE